MPFIKFFWKDFKSDKSFNWFYILCLTLGIIGLLLVESFKVGIEEKIAKNAKNLFLLDVLSKTLNLKISKHIYLKKNLISPDGLKPIH